MNLTGAQNDLLVKLMSASSKRAEVIANNIANQNTPGFKRRVLAFEELLTKALDRGGRDLLSIEPQLTVDEASPQGSDGNNVNIELEMDAMRQNRLMYETYASILASRFEVLRASIESGR